MSNQRGGYAAPLFLGMFNDRTVVGSGQSGFKALWPEADVLCGNRVSPNPLTQNAH